MILLQNDWHFISLLYKLMLVNGPKMRTLFSGEVCTF